jgi:hypothetical protein
LGFGDDDLFDQLGELADREGPDACACETVKNYIMNTLLKSPNIKNYYTPEQITALQDAASASDNRKEKQSNKSDDSFDYAMSTTKAPAESVVKESDRPIMIDGKQVDLNTIEYEMQDVGDNIYDLQGAKFVDGTELSDEQMEKLMVDMDFNNWVQQDHAERYADAMQEAPVDTSDMHMVGIGRGEKEEVQQILDRNKESYDAVLGGEDLITFGKLYRELISYYMSNGEMPYGIAKARDGDPQQWIMDRLDSMGLLETVQEDTGFAGWLRNTHKKEVGQLTPQEYAIVSKQYRDEQDKKKQESVGGGPTVSQMSDLELANFLHTSVAEVKKDREAAEEAAEELNQKYAGDNESVKEEELAAIKKLAGI